MSSSGELRAVAEELLKLAKAAEDFDESLVYVMRSVECETRADLLEQDEVPEWHTADRQIRSSACKST